MEAQGSGSNSMSPEESDLIRRAARKDREAFAELYLRYQPLIRRQLLASLRNAYEADDLTSETFLRAWNAIDRFEDRGISIQNWLSTIAHRLALKHLSRRKPSTSIDDVVLPANSDLSPEASAERVSEVQMLNQALVALPELQREVLSKRFLDELSYEEVASVVGKSKGTVRVIQHRGLKALRQLFVRLALSDVKGS